MLTAALLTLLAAAPADDAVPLQPPPPRFRVETPDVVLTDVPVERVVITALDPDGRRDESYEGQPLVRGIRLADAGREDVALPPFREGTLELTTDRAVGRRVYVTSSRVVVQPEGEAAEETPVFRTLRWFAVVPPLLAIVLAVWLRNVIVALFAAVYCGAVILARGDFFSGFLRTLESHVLDELVGNKEHALIVLFTLFLGATVGVMGTSGGTAALVNRVGRFARTRERGQFMTWAMGLVVFFDDYANTLLVGSSMRPVTDRLRISREKLAFLVDSTAAPIAGVALVSTWVGFEIGLINDAYSQIYRGSDVEWSGFSTFVASLAYRFYPLHLIVFVLLIACTGHDYGPMLRAEMRALADRENPGGGAAASPEESVSPSLPLLRNALIPLAVLLGLVVIGLWWTGSSGLRAENAARAGEGRAALPVTFWSVFAQADSVRVLFFSSFLASVAAVASAVTSRALSFRECIEAWSAGARSMFLACVILVLAWSVATVCDAEHLNTAGFLVELAGGQVSARWMPTMAFLLAAVISFATGSSFATMGLLTPLFITLTHALLLDVNEAHPQHHLMLATIGAILAGAIFGDHCSPISDTTVLSSAATGCDHLDHVATQLPYAGSVALVALVLGYIPVGFGYSPVVLMPLGLVALYLLVQFYGRRAEEAALPPADGDDLALPADFNE